MPSNSKSSLIQCTPLLSSNHNLSDFPIITLVNLGLWRRDRWQLCSCAVELLREWVLPPVVSSHMLLASGGLEPVGLLVCDCFSKVFSLWLAKRWCLWGDCIASSQSADIIDGHKRFRQHFRSLCINLPIFLIILPS